MKVAALTSGINVPSSRYRVRQHINPLKILGAEISEYVPRIEKYEGWEKENARWPAKITFSSKDEYWKRLKIISRIPGLLGSWLSDVTWLERVMIPEYYTLEKYLKKPLVFDFDDAIWLGEGKNGITEKIIQKSDAIIAGNEYLADFAFKLHKKVHVIPTAVDLDSYIKFNHEEDEINLGWIGTSSNMVYLLEILPAIAKVLQDYPKSKLVVISNKPPYQGNIPEDKLIFIPWVEGIEYIMSQFFQIGLMPLKNEEWVLGKCSFKLLQYMAAGLPVCASGFGMNQKVLSESEIGFNCIKTSEWVDSLHLLLSDNDLRKKLGINGNDQIHQKYSLQVISPQIFKILKSVV